MSLDEKLTTAFDLQAGLIKFFFLYVCWNTNVQSRLLKKKLFEILSLSDRSSRTYVSNTISQSKRDQSQFMTQQC